MPKLLFYRKNDELLRVNLTDEGLRVGRSSENDLVVPDPAVSRRQFAIEKSGSGWRIRDVSGKGVEVNGKRVDQAKLTHGAQVRLAQWRAVFELSADEADDDTTQETGSDTARRKPLAEPEAKPAPAGPVFVHVKAKGVERKIPYAGKMFIGTGDQCAVRLQDQFASWQHAVLEQCDFSYFQLQDLRSKNGTYVGRVRIDAAQVPLDCPFQIGESEITLRRAASESTEISGAIYEGMVSNDPAMHRLWETIDRVAQSPMVVAINGESGTGKELVARALHARSSRASGPFCAINCSSLSRALAESELFGYEKGSFTGADKLHQGAFEATSGGTLFLDEVAELPLSVQAKLLRVLESGEIRRVGSSQAIKVDVRVVVATNRDLRTEVKHGAFREDLFWRLAMHLALPPLRERKGDLPLLIHHFIDKTCPPGERVLLSKDAERQLLAHSWPGNIRELKHTLVRALFTRNGARIEAEDVSFEPSAEFVAKALGATGQDPNEDDMNRVFITGKKLDTIVDEVVAKTCRRVGPPGKVADELGVARTTVYRRLESLGLLPSDLADKSKSSNK